MGYVRLWRMADINREAEDCRLRVQSGRACSSHRCRPMTQSGLRMAASKLCGERLGFDGAIGSRLGSLTANALDV